MQSGSGDRRLCFPNKVFSRPNIEQEIEMRDELDRSIIDERLAGYRLSATLQDYPVRKGRYERSNEGGTGEHLWQAVLERRLAANGLPRAWERMGALLMKYGVSPAHKKVDISRVAPSLPNEGGSGGGKSILRTGQRLWVPPGE